MFSAKHLVRRWRGHFACTAEDTSSNAIWPREVRRAFDGPSVNGRSEQRSCTEAFPTPLHTQRIRVSVLTTTNHTVQARLSPPPGVGGAESSFEAGRGARQAHPSLISSRRSSPTISVISANEERSPVEIVRDVDYFRDVHAM